MLRVFRARLKALFLLGVCSVLTIGTALAHDLFIVPDQFRVAPGQSVTIGFHSGDGFPQSSQLPQRLRDASIHSADGTAALTTPTADAAAKRSASTATVTKAGHYIATIVAAANTISMEPAESSAI